MNRSLVDTLVNAVLYEGYILYPYRPSVKNRQRWTFGGLYPEAYCRDQGGSDSPSNQTECLVEGDPETKLTVAVRFLHLTERVVGEVTPPLAAWSEHVDPPFHPVEVLGIGDQTFHSWQEAEERRIQVSDVPLAEILSQPRQMGFRFPGRQSLEPLRGPCEEVAGVLLRRQHGL